MNADRARDTAGYYAGRSRLVVPNELHFTTAPNPNPVLLGCTIIMSTIITITRKTTKFKLTLTISICSESIYCTTGT
jgi:hypothetical protein